MGDARAAAEADGLGEAGEAGGAAHGDVQEAAAAAAAASDEQIKTLSPQQLHVEMRERFASEREQRLEKLMEQRAARYHMTPEELHDQEESAFFFLTMILLLQLAVFVFKHKYPKRFQEVTLLFLTFYPLMSVYRHQDGLVMSFFAMWLVWCSRTLLLVRQATRKPLDVKTPERVYTWFLRTHNVCYFAGMMSLYSFLIIPGPALLVLFFALYFGVMGRDFADLASDRITSTIGYTKYDTPPVNLCALCSEELRPTLDLMSGKADSEEVKETVFTLPCGHDFHVTCIRGWCIVGKKHMCPYCMENVDLKRLLPDVPWSSKRISLLWTRLLELLRFFLVWLPLIMQADLFLLRALHFKPIVNPDSVDANRVGAAGPQ